MGAVAMEKGEKKRKKKTKEKGGRKKKKILLPQGLPSVPCPLFFHGGN